MPGKPKKPVSREEENEKRRAEIAERVQKNPFEYIEAEEMRILLGVGETFWDKLVANRPPPPTLARKYNPNRFFAWIQAHESEFSSVKA